MGAVQPLTQFDLAAIFLALAAAVGWVNQRFLKWPDTVAVVVIGVGGSLLVLGLDRAMPDLGLVRSIAGPLHRFDFSKAVLDIFLAFLMFAGGLSVDVEALSRSWRTTTVLATAGTVVSTALVGAGFWALARLLGYPLSFGWALVFGALISPTDPIAVLATVRRVPIRASVKALMEAESLFNDGVGIVLFGAAVSFAAAGSGGPDTAELLGAVALQSLGGAALGLVAGFLALAAMRRIDNHGVETAITLALAMGVYALAHRLGISGPIAAAAAGLLVGAGHGDRAMSEHTRSQVRGFWRLVDEILNSLLFLLMGLELLLLKFEPRYIGLSLLAIPLVLLARLISVAGPGAVMAHYRRGEVGLGLIPVLTWGGVRGGLSLALALSLPEVAAKPALLAAAYVVAIFSIVVQSTTLAPVVRRLGLSGVKAP